MLSDRGVVGKMAAAEGELRVVVSKVAVADQGAAPVVVFQALAGVVAT
jgi:hypothetical protein